MGVHLLLFYHFYEIHVRLTKEYKLNTKVQANRNIFVSGKLYFEFNQIRHRENSQTKPRIRCRNTLTKPADPQKPSF